MMFNDPEQSSMTLKEYLKQMKEFHKDRPPAELPYIYGNPCADIFCILWSHESVYHVQVNPRMDLIYECETDKLVGVELWGQKERILKQVMIKERDQVKGGDV